MGASNLAMGLHKVLFPWLVVGVLMESPSQLGLAQMAVLLPNLLFILPGGVASDRRHRGTWLAYRGRLELALLLQGDPPLFNPYGVIAVNPERHPHANYAGATALIDWLASAEGQKMIARYSVDGQALFHPLLIPQD